MPKPNQRTSQQRTLCANCNICVNTLRRFVVVELDHKVISLLSERITPLLINEEDVICEACWVILEQEVNEKLPHDNSGKLAGPSNRGHKQVCIICGLSLLRRQSDRILRRNPTDLERAIVNVIESRIAPRQISPSDCVCHPCWLRSRRSAQRVVAQGHIKKERADEPKPPEREFQRARSRSPVNPEPSEEEIPLAIHIKEERVDESKLLEQEIQLARSRSPVEPEPPDQEIQQARSRSPVKPDPLEPEIQQARSRSTVKPDPLEQEIQQARSRSSVEPESLKQEILRARSRSPVKPDPLEQEIQQARSRSPVKPDPLEPEIQQARSRSPVKPDPLELEIHQARSRSPVKPDPLELEIHQARSRSPVKPDPLEQEIQQARSRSPVKPDPLEQEIQQARSRSPVDPILTETEIGRLTLPNYKRAANTASHCLYPGCENVHLRTITDNLRATVLSNYHFYIPTLARVCVEHLHSNDWDSLYNLPSSINYFTAKQIEHVFSFVNTSTCRFDFSSFEAIQEIDDSIFFQWIGRTKEDFAALLQEVPRIKEAHRGVLGLAAFLMKMRTGESDDRISTLLEVPRRTLERLMNLVREILLQDFVPRNMGTCKSRKIVGAQSITRFCAKKSGDM